WACSGRSRRVSRSAISATATPSTTNTPGVSASGLFRGCTRQGRRYAWRVSTVWPSSVERVAEYLRAAGAEARLEELSGDTATAVEAASAAGCELSQIVKSLVLLCDGDPVLALVPGDRRLDVEKARRAAGAAT